MEYRAVEITGFVRRLRGGSQPILAQASDGGLYVVKFRNSLQGPHLMFNESMGAELYRACGLLVPKWRPIYVDERFLDEHRECWLESEDGPVRPSAGWCFASKFVHGPEIRLLDILPGNAICRVRNKESFWLARLIDVCASHADHRQAVFAEYPDRQIDAVFIDHGHLFGGATGLEQPRPAASQYLDPRMYPDPSNACVQRIKTTIGELDAGELRSHMLELPAGWKPQLAQEAFELCLERLTEPRVWENVLYELLSFRAQAERHESSPWSETVSLSAFLCP